MDRLLSPVQTEAIRCLSNAVYICNRLRNKTNVRSIICLFFFFFFLNPIYCPLRRSLTLDFTFWYATPLAPSAIFALLPRSSSAPAQSSPQVIAPHAGPAKKRCFRMHRIGTCAGCSVGCCLVCVVSLLVY